METKQSSSQGMLPIQPLQQDESGRLTGGFSVALQLTAESESVDVDKVKNKQCMNNNCANCVPNCGAQL